MRAHDINSRTLDTRGRSLDEPVVVVKNGGGNLEKFQINELHDGDTYYLPLASSVPENAWVIVELPELYESYTPSVFRSGSDSIVYSDGSDTDVLFNIGTVKVRFVSNGVDEWRI